MKFPPSVNPICPHYVHHNHLLTNYDYATIHRCYPSSLGENESVLAPQVQIPVQVPQVLTTQVPRDSAKSSNDDDDVVVVNATPPSKKQKVMDLVQTALNKVRDDD